MIKSLQSRPTRSATAAQTDLALDLARASEVDACAYLFRAFRTLERAYRDRGITCLFDVEAIKLPESVCRIIALMGRAVIDDVAERALSRPFESTVAITLQRRGTAYAAVIADRGARDYGATSDPDLAPVRLLAAQLGGDCRIRATGDQRVVIVLFDPEQLAAHGLTRRRAIDPIASVHLH